MPNYDVIILNYANCDMVGHTGALEATVKAVEAVDDNLKRVYEECIKNNITLFVCADHGNCEVMIDDDGKICTTHTTNKVPFIICKEDLLLEDGSLCDIVPTMLSIMVVVFL